MDWMLARHAAWAALSYVDVCVYVTCLETVTNAFWDALFPFPVSRFLVEFKSINA